MHIRPATEADLPAIVAMSACFYETTSYRTFADFDPDATGAQVNAASWTDFNV